MRDLFAVLRNEKELRELLLEVTTLIEEMEHLRKENEAFDDNIDDIRRVAKKLYKENRELQEKCHDLEMQNKALRQFIVDEVKDEAKLTKIFFS